MSSEMTLTSADDGSTLRVAVTATNASGSASATSSQTAVVSSSTPPPSGGGGGGGSAAVLPANTAPPVITGTMVAGQNIYTTNGSWSGNPTSYSYQWLRCDSAGANC